jgi:hypothetical protein
MGPGCRQDGSTSSTCVPRKGAADAYAGEEGVGRGLSPARRDASRGSTATTRGLRNEGEDAADPWPGRLKRRATVAATYSMTGG